MSILGTGVTLGLDGYVSDVDLINQSLYLLFKTEKGTRMYNPEFGSSIHELRWEPLDSVLIESLRYRIAEDIRKWEPRVTVEDIEFLETYVDDNVLYISITYKIIKSNSIGNYVFPYRREVYPTDINYKEGI